MSKKNTSTTTTEQIISALVLDFQEQYARTHHLPSTQFMEVYFKELIHSWHAEWRARPTRPVVSFPVWCRQNKFDTVIGMLTQQGEVSKLVPENLADSELRTHMENLLDQDMIHVPQEVGDYIRAVLDHGSPNHPVKEPAFHVQASVGFHLSEDDAVKMFNTNDADTLATRMTAAMVTIMQRHDGFGTFVVVSSEVDEMFYGGSSS